MAKSAKWLGEVGFTGSARRGLDGVTYGLPRARHLPIFPAPPIAGKLQPVDMVANLEAGLLPRLPDVLLVPSDLAPFAKVAEAGVLCVNPGRLTRKQAGGNYATVCVRPPKAEEPPPVKAEEEEGKGQLFPSPERQGEGEPEPMEVEAEVKVKAEPATEGATEGAAAEAEAEPAEAAEAAAAAERAAAAAAAAKAAALPPADAPRQMAARAWVEVRKI